MWEQNTFKAIFQIEAQSNKYTVAVIKDFCKDININDPFGFAQSVILNKKAPS
jgi:hypothetical protein